MCQVARNHTYPQWEGLREEREISCHMGVHSALLRSLHVQVSLQCRGSLHPPIIVLRRFRGSTALQPLHSTTLYNSQHPSARGRLLWDAHPRGSRAARTLVHAFSRTVTQPVAHVRRLSEVGQGVEYARCLPE
eukprot:6880685-Prymnesium_polylepis.1